VKKGKEKGKKRKEEKKKGHDGKCEVPVPS
jgi:hypothetical protein